MLPRRFIRRKSDPLFEEVELLDANPVTLKCGSRMEGNVSTSDLAPCTSPENLVDNSTVLPSFMQTVHTPPSSEDHFSQSELSQLVRL